ncbi:MAG: class I SAM-dependent methyltransferase [Acidobacteriaceae bacterium]|jgi:predicted O-methyltransferase YrrM|nr:class I SAM-dependent methyltransferase [Acidobacteriaceae bacterium]
MSSAHIEMTAALSGYLREVSLRDHPLLARLRAATASHPRAVMQITPEQGQFMQLLLRLTGARRTIEIGVFTGYSALITALALPEDGQVIACDISDEWTSLGRPYWQEAGVAHKIDLRLAPALETLNTLTGPFDFAFIDADKVNYDAYYERCLQLVRPGGLILIDNTLWHGDVINPAKQDADTLAIRALNKKLQADPRIDLSLLPLGDGLTVCRICP